MRIVLYMRDIKPDNIFVGSCIQVGDFGLAKMLEC